MSKSMLMVGVIILAVLALASVNIINNYQSSNELDQSLLRDTVEAAMYDSVDVGYYRVSGGIIRIDKEKFAENFTRRFAASISGDVTEYEIEFYDIIESPPKATVLVRGKSKEYMLAPNESKDTFFIENSLSGNLEVYDVES